ncbi:hypothetical protein HZC53_02560 [Candidatus Uhrbacteria bacterium]|nr:hypothetical protein [Candidatus Uhrbacteria bacterium]
MRKILTVALFIAAACISGCSSCSKSSDEGDAAPPVTNDACCTGLLKLCIEQIDNTKRAYPSLNETRKLCPGIPAGEVQFPLTSDELNRVHAMANSANCCEDAKVCRDLRDKAVAHLSKHMQDLSRCDR